MSIKHGLSYVYQPLQLLEMEQVTKKKGTKSDEKGTKSDEKRQQKGQNRTKKDKFRKGGRADAERTQSGAKTGANRAFAGVLPSLQLTPTPPT